MGPDQYRSRRTGASLASPRSLELHEPQGAFEQLERFLREHGFFATGGEDLVADLYLGYGLSQTLRREHLAGPPEPCPLPLAACSVRPNRYVADDDNYETATRSTATEPAISIGRWRRTWSPAAYAAAVERVREAIARGDVYQVNLVQHLCASFAGSTGALASRLAALRPHNPAPLHGDGWTIVSGSPELFLARRGRRIWTKPIKGTRAAGAGSELAASSKDVAEHVMIVDLERNDLSRVCLPGSVRWPELMATRTLAGVEHMVSTVEGTLRDDVGLAELLAATFPGGSITGAPKIAAIDLIAALEPVGRGASMGALGWVRGNGDLDLALTIRTFAIAGGRIHLWVGGGIVWDSDPAGEVEESWMKARPLLEAIDAPFERCGDVDRGPG